VIQKVSSKKTGSGAGVDFRSFGYDISGIVYLNMASDEKDGAADVRKRPRVT
jgi:hypothetical protein